MVAHRRGRQNSRGKLQNVSSKWRDYVSALERPVCDETRTINRVVLNNAGPVGSDRRICGRPVLNLTQSRVQISHDAPVVGQQLHERHDSSATRQVLGSSPVRHCSRGQ